MEVGELEENFEELNYSDEIGDDLPLAEFPGNVEFKLKLKWGKGINQALQKDSKDCIEYAENVRLIKVALAELEKSGAFDGGIISQITLYSTIHVYRKISGKTYKKPGFTFLNSSVTEATDGALVINTEFKNIGGDTALSLRTRVEKVRALPSLSKSGWSFNGRVWIFFENVDLLTVSSPQTENWELDTRIDNDPQYSVISNNIAPHISHERDELEMINEQMWFADDESRNAIEIYDSLSVKNVVRVQSTEFKSTIASEVDSEIYMMDLATSPMIEESSTSISPLQSSGSINHQLDNPINDASSGNNVGQEQSSEGRSTIASVMQSDIHMDNRANSPMRQEGWSYLSPLQSLQSRLKPGERFNIGLYNFDDDEDLPS